MTGSTISLQIGTSYQQTPLTTGAISYANAANKNAVQTPPSVQVQAGFEPPAHTGLPIGGAGADVKGAALNYSGGVQDATDVASAVKG